MDTLVSRALARAMAASRPRRSTDVSTRVVVTVQLNWVHQQIFVTGRYHAGPLTLSQASESWRYAVADTGQAIAGLQEVQACLQSCSAACHTLEGHIIHVQTTALDEACIHAFTVCTSPEGSVQTRELPSLPKLCPKGPFSGSEVTFPFALPEGGAGIQRAWDILSSVQEVMEPLIMVAPPIKVQLRIKGFDDQMIAPEQGPLPARVLYSLEDVPDYATPAQRLAAGLQAFFVHPTDTSAEEGSAAEAALASEPIQIYTGPSVTATGSGATAWTACAGLVLCESAEADAQPSGLSVSLFENYAVLQRPVQPLLKALERVDWASFGLTTQVTVGEGIGTANLTFTQGSDEICQLMQALVIHIVPPAATLSPVRPERRALGLPAKTEAKLVKSAVTKALSAVKEARPLSLQSGFEQRMGCLADIARSVSTLVAQSENAAFQEAACSIANTGLDSLKDAIHESLEAIAVASMPHTKGRGGGTAQEMRVPRPEV